MSLNITKLENVGTLKKFHSGGGEGTISTTTTGKLVKIYDTLHTKGEIDKKDSRLRTIGANDAFYNGLSHFCAVPEVLIEKNGKIMGFQMTHFQGFDPLSSLLSMQFCIDRKITIRKIAMIFLAIHKSLCDIHGRGFIVGDLNYENIMFKFVNKSVLLAFVDVDSWGIRSGSLFIPPSSGTTTFCHPELEEDSARIQQYHDWYSFAVLLSQSLIKDDPFNLGVLDKVTMNAIKGERQKNGITCWDARVTLRNEHIPYVKRFGNKLPEELRKWLKGNQKGIFPKNILEEFLNGLSMCTGLHKGKKCTLEVHIDHSNCTRCGEKLSQPIPRARYTPPQSPQQSPPSTDVSDLLDSICRMGK